MNKRKRLSAHASLFGASELVRPSRCSVIVAHPYDEVIGAGGLISRLRDVTILHVTEGAPAEQETQTAGSAAGANHSKARKEGCASALALANVRPDQIEEFGVTDIWTPRLLADLAKRIAVFLQRSETEIVLTHPYDGGHPDHDATAFATHAAVRLVKHIGFKPPALFEIALHPSRDGKKRVLDFLPGSWRETTTLVLNEEARNLKRRMFDCFTTQQEGLRGTPLGREKFRTPPAYDFSVAPNSGKPAYENFHTGMTGPQWQTLARKALAELFPKEFSRHQRNSESVTGGSSDPR